MKNEISLRERYGYAVILLGFFLLFSLAGVYRHITFQTAAFDLGIFDQAVWQYSQFSLPYSSLKEMVLLGDHFSPILAFLSPLYWVWADPAMLILLQSLTVCISVVPLILIFRKEVTKRFLGCVLFMLMYLTFVGIHNGLSFGVHPAVMVVLPLSVLFWSLHFKKWRWYWGTFGFALLFKEDIALVLFSLGLYEFFVLKFRRIGLITSAISLIYFLLVIFMVMPIWSGVPAGGYIDATAFGSTPLGMVRGAVENPGLLFTEFWGDPVKRYTFLTQIASFGFLPLFSLLAWFLAAPMYVARFFSANELRWALDFHYSASIAPVYAIGFIHGWRRFSRYVRMVPIQLFLILSLTLSIAFTYSHGTLYPISKVTSSSVSNAEEALSFIPNDVPVSAQSPFVPHLSHREEIYLYPEGLSQAKYVIVSRQHHTFPLHYAQLDRRIEEHKVDYRYNLVFQRGEVYVFTRVGD